MRSSAEIRQEITRRIWPYGGVWMVPEADDVLNDLNRELLAAMKRENGLLYMGKFNIYDRVKRQAVASGEASPYTELKDQTVYNFDCDFAVPYEDQQLAELLREWSDDATSTDISCVEKMINRVEEIGGVLLNWT